MPEETRKITVYGAEWCPGCDRVKRFLIERDLDFRYVNIDHDPGAAEEAVDLAGGKRVMPLVLIDGDALVDPSNEALRAKLGAEKIEGQCRLCDVIVVGAGVTGLSAAIYTTRDRLNTLLIEKAVAGGQIMATAAVENYPGFPEPISGADLTDRLVTQAKRFGAKIAERTEVRAIQAHADRFVIKAVRDDEPREFQTRAVILAPGSEYRRLNVPGEKEFAGYGVSYCATCDAPFYRGKHVVAVGGGNTAVDEGLHMLKFATRLTIVQNLDRLTATPFLVEELNKKKDQVDILYDSAVEEIKGKPKEHVTGVVIKDRKTGRTREIACDGVFVWIGMTPNTVFVRGLVELDKAGFIVAQDCSMMTAMPGLLAAGDCRSGSKKQIATAAGEGVIAAMVAADYLKKQKTAQSGQ